MRFLGLAALVAGCYSARIEPCLVACSSMEACPAGLSCDEGLCNTPGGVNCGVLLDGGGSGGDGGVALDARAIDAAVGLVGCAGTACAECCVSGETATCDTTGCNAYGSLYRCDGPEDCPGAICCLDWFMATASCTATTSCVSPGHFVVCHDAADCSGGACGSDGSGFYGVCEPGPLADCAGQLCFGGACCAGSGTAPLCSISCTPGTTAYYCDGPEDCPGGACCLTSTGAYSDCVSVCDVGERMCHDDLDCEGSGPSNCSTDPSGSFHYCN